MGMIRNPAQLTHRQGVFKIVAHRATAIKLPDGTKCSNVFGAIPVGSPRIIYLRQNLAD